MIKYDCLIRIDYLSQNGELIRSVIASDDVLTEEELESLVKGWERTGRNEYISPLVAEWCPSGTITILREVLTFSTIEDAA